ncbi:MAG: AsmA family protein, partial [Deferribacteraceae bacterium]|nr:AsmA family protein [Deferribacteraceae bacterium]
MKKFVKIALIALGSLILLLILAVIILPMIIDVNSFKPQITKIVSDQTGRELTIDGDIKLRVLPRLSIDLTGIRFTNAEGFEPENMASIGHASFGVALFPLLSKEIRVTRIILEDTELYYAVNAEGVTNIDDILALQAAKAEAAPVEEPEPEPTEEAPMSINMEDINVGLLRISNMKLSYNDERLGVQYLLSEAGVEAEDIALAKPVDLTMQAKFQELKSQMAAGLDMAMTGFFDGSLATADLTKLTLSYSAPESGIDVTANLVANTKFNLDTQVAELSGTVLDVVANMQSADFSLASDVKLELPAASFDLTRTYLDLPAMNVSGGYTVSMIEGRQSLSAALSKLTLDMQQESVALESFNLQTMDINVNAALAGQKILSAPDIKGSVRLAEFSPRSVLAKLKVDYTPSNATAMTKFGMATDFTLANNLVTAPIALTLDDTKLNISTTVDLAGAKPVITASTELDAINVDKYLPAKAATDTAAAPAAPAAASAEPAKLEYPEVALDLSTAPNFTVSFKAGKISMMGEALNALAVQAKGVDGIVDVSMGTALNQGAKINADAHITAKPNNFNAAANLNVAALDLHKALLIVDPKMDLSIIPKRGAVSLSASIGNKALTLSKLNASADAITVAGNAKLDFTPATKPLATFRFDINRINANDFLPKKAESAQPETAAQVQQQANAATGAPEINLPLDADGVVKLGALTYDRITVSNISAALKVKDNNVSVAPVSGSVWGGSFNVTGSVASKGGKLPAALKLNLASI